jgi:hypothetical protein
LVLAAAGVAAPPARGATVPAPKLQAERFQLRGGAKLAPSRRAVVLSGRASLRKTVALPRLQRVLIRARARRCHGFPRVGASIGGRRVASFAIRSARARNYSRAVAVAPGTRRVVVRLLNGHRWRACKRRAVVDYLVLAGAASKLQTAPTPQQADPAAASGPLFTNPVFGSFADPMVLDVGGAHTDYYAYATGGGFPIARSSDLVHWSSAGTAMTGRPSWAQQTGDYNPWAPTVVERPGACPGAASGPCYVMFYVSKHASMDPPADCIGIATASTPGGPFVDRGPLQDAPATTDASGRPIGCGDDAGYSNIDPAPFVDSGGNAYLYLSTGHRCTTPVAHAVCNWDHTISVIPLTPGLLQAAGARQPLFASGGPWEQSIVENPWMRKTDGVYELFYSGGVYTGAYGMGYATASSPTGPFTKSSANPVLHDSDAVKSAGGGSLVTGPRGGVWLAYHGRTGSYAAGRVLRIDPVRGGGASDVAIEGPSTTPQPVP